MANSCNSFKSGFENLRLHIATSNDYCGRRHLLCFGERMT